jgi:hypothetical protein
MVESWKHTIREHRETTSNVQGDLKACGALALSNEAAVISVTVSPEKEVGNSRTRRQKTRRKKKPDKPPCGSMTEEMKIPTKKRIQGSRTELSACPASTSRSR